MTRFDKTPRAELGIAAAAGLMGAAGVALGAVAAHKVPTPAMASAAQMLMVHAVAVLAIAAWAVRSTTAGGWWRAAARAMLLGVALFAGDIALRGFEVGSLFPMAAPIGGSLTIVAWVIVAVAAGVEWARS
jgi:uncharacterized membrane protein YgdD (TMEM256/DUF423 family)